MLANGLSTDTDNPQSLSQPVQGPSRHSHTASLTNHTATPSRKRHSSQQMGGTAKDLRVGGSTKNRFEVLTQINSYDDKTMRPASIASTPGPSNQFSFHAASSNDYSIPKTVHAATPAAACLLDNLVFKDDNLVVSEGVFDIRNDRAMRQEIEISLETLNGEPFRGTITPQEAKFSIFKESLGFGNFTNFDGVRLAYKGGPVLVFKLKSAINVDELIHIQHFNFLRKSTRQGVLHTDTVGCKIRGLRIPDPNAAQNCGPEFQNRKPKQDDGTRTIKIDGCEYRNPKDVLLQVLSLYGTVLTDVVEVLLTDGCDPENTENGSNRTGTYAVKVRLTKKIPQLIPIMGKRIKISYQGIQRLCTNCFGNHAKQYCHSKKVMWHQYVARFKESNPEFPSNLLPRGGIPRSDVTVNENDVPHQNPPYINSDCNLASAKHKSVEVNTAAWVDSISNGAMDSTMDDEIVPSQPLIKVQSRSTTSAN